MATASPEPKPPAPAAPPPGRVRGFFGRWQEMLFWLPGSVLLAVIGYVVLGAFPGAQLPPDLLSTLAEIPVLCAHAAAACAATWLFLRTNWFLKRRSELAALYTRAGDGELGALYALILQASVWLATLALFAWFFSPSR